VAERAMMNLTEAAAYLGWSENTLRKLMRTTDIPHRRLGPRLVLFSRSALDAWAAGPPDDPTGGQTGAQTEGAPRRPFVRVPGKILDWSAAP